MANDPNDSPKPGWGITATLKLIVTIVVTIIAGGAILLVLDMLSLAAYKQLLVKTLLVGGVSLLAGLILGLLSRPRR